MTASAVETLLKPLVILSLLGDSPTSNAATRLFRGKPVIQRTCGRISAAANESDIVVLVWDDQMETARKAVGEAATVESVGPRRETAQMQTASASLRWADGWRGGLLGVSSFDRGFDAKWIVAALEARACNAAILVDANAGLIESRAIDALIDHLSVRSALDYAFLPGTPGSGAMILRIDTLRDLQRTGRLPGQLLAYHPDRPQHDPLAKEFAVPVAPRVARSLVRLTLESDRQIGRLSLLQSVDESSDGLVAGLQSSARLDPMPREIVVELTTQRMTTPIFSPLSATAIQRPPMEVERARRLFAQLAQVDDLRLTFAGVGDPLMHEQFEQILLAAREAGIRAIHVETDLLTRRSDHVQTLASGSVDVVSIHVPAAHRDTYQELMGIDAIHEVIENLKGLVTVRSRNRGGLPIVVPLFTKCERNLAEMEEWYDQWIRAVGAAVVRGPSDFGGMIPYVGVSDMLPPVRKACRRLGSRMTVLCDGSMVSCEEDVFGRQAIGHVDRDQVGVAWMHGLASLRSSRDTGAVCRACRMWDRP